MKTKNEELQLIWDDLQKIFGDFKFLTQAHIDKLEKLGFKVVKEGKHPKMYFYYKETKYIIVLSSTPSDRYVGRQILRQIRRVYENN